MSFAAEMKDFVGAWTAVSEMGNNKKKLDLQKQEIENLQAYRDETIALDRKQLEMSRTNSDRNYALAQERNAISRQAAADAKEAAAANGVFESLGGAEQNFDWSMEGEAIPTDEVSMQARGGLVARAAEGGLIEEPTEEAIPLTPPVAGAGRERSAARTGLAFDPNANVVSKPAAPAAAPAAQPDPKVSQSVAADAQAAVADAAPALIEDAKRPEAAVGPDAEAERMDIVNNRGGLSMAEYKELIATIDPNDSIPAYLKSAAVLASTHRYFMENGQPEKAQRIAKGILILNKQMTQTLGALAQNAMEEGNVPAAAQLVTDAANQFPTSSQFKIDVTENGLTYTMMQDGKEAGSGELSTDQLWELTGKVKNGSLYIQEMGRLAGAGSGKVGPSQALELTSNAYAAAKQAQEALILATEEGADPEELNALRTQARTAAATYTKFRNNALQMGIKRTDIQSLNDEAYEMAIPAGEQPEDGALSSQEGAVTSDGNTVQFDDMPAPKSQAERDALPPGTKYVAPDGSIRTR